MEIDVAEFTTPEAARYLGVSEETVRRNIRSRRLRAIRRGTQWFIDRQDLAVFASKYDAKTGKIRSLFD